MEKREEKKDRTGHGEGATGCLVMLIGLPGSGKSTLAPRLGEKVVSSDEIRRFLTGRYDDFSQDPLVFDLAELMVERYLRQGKRVVLDATNINRPARRRFLELARFLSCPVRAVVLEPEEEVAQERNVGREKPVPPEVISSFARRFEPPNPEEGFSDVTYVGPEADPRTFRLPDLPPAGSTPEPAAAAPEPGPLPSKTPQGPKEQFYLAVIGPGRSSPREEEQAERVGEEAARRGAVILCGGLGGVMEAAARGARRRGGLVVGLLPGVSRRQGNRYLSLALPTGMGEARNVLLIRAADAAVAVGGGFGTLSEIALALRMGKPVIGLASWGLLPPGGRGLPAEAREEEAGAPPVPLYRAARDPGEAVELALRLGALARRI